MTLSGGVQNSIIFNFKKIQFLKFKTKNTLKLELITFDRHPTTW